MNFKNISSKIIKHSICASTGKEIVTFEVTYPRIILPEVLTHRVFSRNTSSSRAVPSKKMSYRSENIFYPSHWGKNKPGMSASEELSGYKLFLGKSLWRASAASAFCVHWLLSKLGGHKQWVNRIIEPYLYIKQIITTTELENFFALRIHKDAQPEIQILAETMFMAYNAPHDFHILDENDWHLPYVNIEGDSYYAEGESTPLTIQEAILTSVSACAQVSYRATDFSLEKSKKIFKMLNVFDKENPVHASPLEHQAKLLTKEEWPIGVTHIDRDGDLWSGNLRGFAQLRHILAQSDPKAAVGILGDM